MAQARELGSNWVQGLPLDASERIIARLQASRPSRCRRSPRKYFGDDQLTVAILRPLPLDPNRKPRAPPRRPATALKGRCIRMFQTSDSRSRRGLLAGAALLSSRRALGRASRSSTGRRPSGAKVYLVDEPRAADRRRAGRLRRRRPARPGRTGRPGQRHRRHDRQGHRAPAAASPALDENALGEAWADLGAELRRRRRHRPHELHAALADRSRPADQGRAAGRARDRRAVVPRRRLAARARAHRRRDPRSQHQARHRRRRAPSRRPSTARIPTATRRPKPRWRRSTSPTCARCYAQLIVPCRAKVSIVGAVTRAQADAHRDDAAVAPAARPARCARAAAGARSGSRSRRRR